MIENFEVYLAPAVAACYSVTFRVGRAIRQKNFLIQRNVDPVAEFLECVDLFLANDHDKLKNRIGDETYHRNFVYQLKRLGPDGTPSANGRKTRKTAV